MGNYYYLVAQLPYLKFNETPPISTKKFLAESRKWLSEKELTELQRTQLEGTNESADVGAILKKYYHFENRLKKELVAWRKARQQGTEHKIDIFDPGILKDGTPLDSELKLLRLRWKFLDELAAGFEFEFPVLLIYYIKLQVLERLQTFDHERGLEKFKHYTEVSL